MRYYGKWMRDEAEKRIGRLYPPVEVTPEAVRQQPALAKLKGQKLTVIAWLWARTVASPNPAAKGAHVPLVSSFMLSTKAGKQAWVVPVTDPDAPHGYRFEVHSGTLGKAEEEKAKAGTKTPVGADFRCVLTDTPIKTAHIKAEGRVGRIGSRLIAIVAESKRGRIYLPATMEHEQIAQSAVPLWEPEGALFEGALGFRVPAYGFTEWRHLFTQRQLVALTTFSDLVSEARTKVLADARAAGVPADGAEAYADAVATYLGLGVSRLADAQNSLCQWGPDANQTQHLFRRQAISMVWDYAESSVFSAAAGDYFTSIKSLCRALDALVPVQAGTVVQVIAQTNDYPVGQVLISSDPPYYDNIGYADLSDFFYVWLRRSLSKIHPGIFRTLLVPKDEELVATPDRHDGRDAAEAFFLDGMKRAIAHMAHASADNTPLAIYYAFKQSEVEQEGIASTGWATFLQGIANANLVIDGTLPIRTERPVRSRGIGSNALASSIVLVCRKRPADAPVTTRAAFLAALKRELPAALHLLQAGNIAPVDLAQASIGPGMGIFTRHAKVLEADDSAMTVKTALQLINAALDDYLSEQEGEYDPETRYAITWFETNGMEPAGYGDAETLAKARNVSVSGVRDSGLIESKAGKVRLKKRSDLPAGWQPADDQTPTVWECAQHLIRVLESDGESAAAQLLARLGPRADATRDLAYRLYQVCERKKWAEEARAYNGLVVAWPELQKLAAQRAAPEVREAAQGALL